MHNLSISRLRILYASAPSKCTKRLEIMKLRETLNARLLLGWRRKRLYWKKTYRSERCHYVTIFNNRGSRKAENTMVDVDGIGRRINFEDILEQTESNAKGLNHS